MKDPRFVFETDVSPSEILETLLDEEAARMRRYNKTTSATDRSNGEGRDTTSSGSVGNTSPDSFDPRMASPNFRFGNLAAKHQELIADFYMRVSTIINKAYIAMIGEAKRDGLDL